MLQTGAMAEVIELLPSRHQALSSNISAAKYIERYILKKKKLII
jgi:hypothetical protein